MSWRFACGVRAMMGLAVLGLGGVAATEASAAAAPVVVELFTSQGCSSCPPADDFLTELARDRPDVLPLAFHVTYWDYLGWKDPYSLTAATDRQQAYAQDFGDNQVYTPEMVVDGKRGLVGSDRPAVLEAISEARAERGTDIAVRVAKDGQGLVIAVGPGAGHAQVLLVGYDPEHRTVVGAGENGGRTLQESNIVRSLSVAGDWAGTAAQFHVGLPAGERFAVLLQGDDGRILGAAAEMGSAS
jgi:hypothetical protein